MLAIPPNSKVYLAISPVDFRKQIPGLKKWIQRELQLDPLSSAYFIFISRNKKSIKILHFEGQGIWLHQKKLSSGKFKGWKGIYDSSLKYISIHSLEAQTVYMNGTGRTIDIQKNWKEVGS